VPPPRFVEFLSGGEQEGGSGRRRGGGAWEEVPPAWGEVAGNGWLVRRGKKAVEGSRDKIFFETDLSSLVSQEDRRPNASQSLQWCEIKKRVAIV